ncbi:hypothetical protein CCUS01_13072 [Colletotrichum cuscutae]|uniref:Uncharacterized protein n=1 Tax=Colletotrichum cuscutae TaxID=1209917 RepID=A0AAJ0DQ60_9PEZI|nr:hypothetical protein CCUS01_13072 [Colletotrichum cuscutae]
MSLTPYHTNDGHRENFATSIGFGIEASRLESAARYMGDFCVRVGSAESKSDRDAGSWYGSWARESQKKGEKNEGQMLGSPHLMPKMCSSFIVINLHHMLRLGVLCTVMVSRLVLVVMTVSVFYGRNRGTGQLGETQIWEIARSGQFPTNPTNAGLQQMGSVRQVASLQVRTISVFLVRRLEPQRTPPPAPGPVTTVADPSAVQSKDD